MLDNEKLHEINYTIDNFRHLLTDTERSAVDAVVFTVRDGIFNSLLITLKSGEEPTDEIKQLLAGGMFDLRKKLAKRLLATHKSEIYENSCRSCGHLPATPRAKQCRTCGNSWRETPGGA